MGPGEPLNGSPGDPLLPLPPPGTEGSAGEARPETVGRYGTLCPLRGFLQQEIKFPLPGKARRRDRGAPRFAPRPPSPASVRSLRQGAWGTARWFPRSVLRFGSSAGEIALLRPVRVPGGDAETHDHHPQDGADEKTRKKDEHTKILLSVWNGQEDHSLQTACPALRCIRASRCKRKSPCPCG